MYVDNWNYYYSIGIGDLKSLFYDGPYSQLSTLKLKGSMNEPKGSTFTRCEVTLSAKRGLLDERRNPPISIGSLDSYGSLLKAYI